MAEIAMEGPGGAANVAIFNVRATHWPQTYRTRSPKMPMRMAVWRGCC